MSDTDKPGSPEGESYNQTGVGRPTVNVVHAGPTGKERKPRSRVFWLARVAVLLVLLVVSLVALLPTLISRGVGQSFILSQIESATDAEVQADAIRVGWWSPPSLLGLHYRANDGSIDAKMQSLELPDRSLLDLLGGLDLGRVEVSGVDLQLTLQESERKPQSEPWWFGQPLPLPEGAAWPHGLAADVHVVGLNVELNRPGTTPVLILLPEVLLKAADPASITLATNGSVIQGSHEGTAALDLSIRDAVDSSGTLNLDEAEVDASLSLRQAPTAFLAALTGDPRLPGMLGPLLSADLRAKGGLDALSAVVQAKTDHSQLSARVAANAQGLAIDGEETAGRWTVTPAGYALAMGLEDGDGQARLASPVTLALHSLGLKLPYSGHGFVVDDASAAVVFQSTPIAIEVPADPEDPSAKPLRVEAEDLKLRVDAPILSDSAQAELTMLASINGVQAPAGLVVNLTQPMSALPKGVVRVQKLPIALLDALLQQGGELTRLMGAQVDVTARFEPVAPAVEGGPPSLVFAMDASSDTLDAKLTGTRSADGVVTLRTPDDRPIRITAPATLVQRYAFPPQTVDDPAAPEVSVDPPSDAAPPVVLQGDIPVTVQLAPLRFAPNADATEVATGSLLDPAGSELDLTVTLNTLDFTVTGEDELYRASVPKLRVVGERGLDEIKLGLTVQLTPPGSTPGLVQTSTLQLGGSVQQLFDPDGVLQPQTAELDLAMQGQIPAPLLQALAQDPRVSAALGGDLAIDRLVTKGSLGRGLRVVAQTRSPSTSLNIDANILPTAVTDGAAGENGDAPPRTLTLNENATATVAITPALSDAVLRWVNPMLLDARGAGAPVKLTLQAEGWSVPITGNLDSWTSALGEAQVELGAVQFGSRGLLAQLHSFLRSLRVTDEPTARLAFEPFTLSLADGELRMPSAFAAMDRIRLGFESKIDLSTQGLAMRMVWPGESIQSVIPQLNGRLPQGTGLVIPIGGTVTAPRYDPARMTQELQNLVVAGVRAEAANQVQRQIERQILNNTGDHAELFSGLLGEILFGSNAAPAHQAAEPHGSAAPAQESAPVATEPVTVEDAAQDAARQILGGLLREAIQGSRSDASDE